MAWISSVKDWYIVPFFSQRIVFLGQRITESKGAKGTLQMRISVL
jgi:hypothetical protein